MVRRPNDEGSDMRRHRLVLCGLLAVLTMAALMIAGCGGDGDITTTAPTETTAPAVSTTATPATTASTAAAPTTTAPATGTTAATQPSTPSSSGQSTSDGWKTVATLASDTAPWQDMPGLLISEPFTLKGDARVVLDMPGAGELDGVILGIVQADSFDDPLSLIDAIRDGRSIVLIPSAPPKEVEGLDGTYVLVNTVPTEVPWTVELQTP